MCCPARPRRLPQLASLLRRLQRKATEAPGLLDDVVKSLDEAMLSLDAAQSGVEAALRATEYDPQRLEKAEERLFALRAASRKHSVAGRRSGAAARHDGRPISPISMPARSACRRWKSRPRPRARPMTARPRSFPRCAMTAAIGLTKAVMAELPALKLERADFIVEMTSEADNRMEEGIDQVEFWVRTNPGTRPGPMMKVASGGELSRFLLALKVALADRGSAPTLVFDEIDTGVGGAVADAIGQRLARLSKRVQVLSVTHAPQVAARAATHFLISKSGGTDRVATGIAEMDTAGAAGRDRPHAGRRDDHRRGARRRRAAAARKHGRGLIRSCQAS